MLAKLARFLAVGVIGVIALWWGRMMAHSKTPPPEGRWREIDQSALGGAAGPQEPPEADSGIS